MSPFYYFCKKFAKILVIIKISHFKPVYIFNSTTRNFPKFIENELSSLGKTLSSLSETNSIYVWSCAFMPAIVTKLSISLHVKRKYRTSDGNHKHHAPRLFAEKTNRLLLKKVEPLTKKAEGPWSDKRKQNSAGRVTVAHRIPSNHATVPLPEMRNYGENQS